MVYVICAIQRLFIIKRDLNDVLVCGSAIKSWSEICNYIGVDSNKMDSIILYEPGLAYYYKSEAALKIASQLGFSIPCPCFKIIPERVRNHFTIILLKTGTAGLEKKGCMYDSTKLNAKF
jgi:predicted DCC family thiol-disulfide oxidoreductase YuxK